MQSAVDRRNVTDLPTLPPNILAALDMAAPLENPDFPSIPLTDIETGARVLEHAGAPRNLCNNGPVPAAEDNSQPATMRGQRVSAYFPAYQLPPLPEA